MSTPQPPAAPLDPLAVLKGLAALRRLTGTYPPGHPMIGQKLKELGDLAAAHLQDSELLRIDVIRGDVFLDSVPSSTEGQANQQLLDQLTALGVDSIHITPRRRARGVPRRRRVPLAVQRIGRQRGRAARVAQRPTHQPGQADSARHALARAAVARRADGAARSRTTRNRSSARSRRSRTPPPASRSTS